MEQITIQIVAVVAVVGTLLGWVVRKVLIWLMGRIEIKDLHIENLVKQNQKNVDRFVDTVNHNQTKNTKAISKLADNVEKQTEVFKQLIPKK